MHHKGALRAESKKHLGERLDPLPGKDADQMAAHARWIRQRAQQIENCARTEFDAGWMNVPGCRMMKGREHETDACLSNAAAYNIGRDINSHAQRS